MVDLQPEVPDEPRCPLPGLATDERTRSTFPHSGHRWRAARTPQRVVLSHQSTHCLIPNFTACNQYQVSHRPQGIDRLPKSPRSDEGAPAVQAIAASTTSAPETLVTHIFRAGDSLARIASIYGLTVEQVAAANRFASPDAVVDGQRLAIPLRSSSATAGVAGPPWADRSG